MLLCAIFTAPASRRTDRFLYLADSARQGVFRLLGIAAEEDGGMPYFLNEVSLMGGGDMFDHGLLVGIIEIAELDFDEFVHI